MEKEVKLQRLTLTNWRGQNKSIEPNGNSVVISGTNHSGKSSMMNAFLWLILGTDHLDRANYLLFDNTIEQTYENAVPAEVEAKILVDGQPYTLKKVATQGWVRRRGSETYERSGSDNYAFYLDGIERTSTQFKADIEDLFGAPIERLKIILNINYFLGLKWDVQRKLLGEIIGEITEEELGVEFHDIISQLSRFTIDELKQKYKGLLKPAKEQMGRLPVAIETMQSSLVSIDGVEEAKAAIAKLKEESAVVDAQIADKVKAVEAIQNKRIEELKAISRKEEALLIDKRNYERALLSSPEILAVEKEIDKLERENANLAAQRGQDRQEIEYGKRRITALEADYERFRATDAKLRQEMAEIKARQFSNDKCPYCGQELPEDRLEAAKLKFAEKNESDKEAVRNLGRSNKRSLEETQQQIAIIKSEIATLEAKQYTPKDVTPLKEKLEAIKSALQPYEQTIEYADKLREIEDMKKSLTVVPEVDTTELKERKAYLQEQMMLESSKTGAEAIRASQLDNIAKMNAELRNAGIEAAKYEGVLELISKYERTKAEIVRQRVNHLFQYCDVQMETLDKSGNAVPTCIINDNGGVDARVTNTASAYNCRIDIAMAFAKFYGVSLPLFIDNAESVNNNCLIPTICQTLELRVSENPFTMEVR